MSHVAPAVIFAAQDVAHCRRNCVEARYLSGYFFIVSEAPVPWEGTPADLGIVPEGSVATTMYHLRHFLIVRAKTVRMQPGHMAMCY